MKLFACLLTVAMVGVAVEANCPGDMEQINGKCYSHGVATSWAAAEEQCKDIGADNHLWILNDVLEMENVMKHFEKRMVTPWAWTDGIRTDADETGHDIWEWSQSGARLSYYPDHVGQDCAGTCVPEDCGTEEVGDCVTISMSSTGERSYQACDCKASFSYICESPDEVTWKCPEETGFFPAFDGACSDLWYNCFQGHATPEYCGEGLIFNAEAQYCDFPDNVESCRTTTTAAK